MSITKFIFIVTPFLSVTTASAQNTVQDYFKGNKDSLAIENRINMPEPTFKPFQTTNIAE